MFSLVVYLSVAFFCQNSAFAAESVEPSASLRKSAVVTNAVSAEEFDPRIEKLKKFLTKYKSPLLPYAEYIVVRADESEIPWSLVVAIAGVESTFCKVIPPKSYNCWGWRNGKHSFENYQVAIEIVSKTLKSNYFKKGLVTPERIGPTYAPPTPSWGAKVRYFMNQIENESSFSPSKLRIFI